MDVNARNADGRLKLHDCFDDDFTKILLEAGALVDVCAAAAYGINDRLRGFLASDLENANDLRTGISWKRSPNLPKILR